MAPKAGSSTAAGGAGKRNPQVGPALPPGRTQPTNDDKEIEGSDSESDYNSGGGTPFSSTKDKGLAGLLIEIVSKEQRDIAYYAIDKLMIRLRKLRTRVEVLEG